METLQPVPREILRAIKEMPAISPVMGKINKISREMETSPKELIKIIMLDPVLTGKVIKLVNSSFYGLTQKVQTLAQAVVYLGVNTVKNLAISTTLMNSVLVREKKSPLDPEAFWRHCLATAVAARFIAKQLRIPPDKQESYFIAGLLHDVGKVVFIKTDVKRYEQMLGECRELGVSLVFAELAHFGCTHAHVGGLLGRSWQLDQYLIDVIENHHWCAGPADSSVINVILIANNLCKRTEAGESGNPVIEERALGVGNALGLTAAMVEEISGRLPDELDKAMEFLNILKEG